MSSRHRARSSHRFWRSVLIATLFAPACDRVERVDGDSPTARSDAAGASVAAVDSGVQGDCGLGLSIDPRQCELVRALLLPAALPASAGNRVADDPRAARLGFLTFFDTHFSPLPDVRCATCHLPEHAFDDEKAVSESSAGLRGVRNSPSLLNAAWAGPFYFWDGRADSLWSQPLFAIENVDEMNGSRLQVAHALADNPTYRAQYEDVFGPLPALSDAARFPPRGKPGDLAFDAMAAADIEAINLVSANFGKAMEAYLRKLATGPTALDRLLSGDLEALSASEKSGLSTFVNRGCISCHAGPALSDGKFYALGAAPTDRGRAAGLMVLASNPFNAHGAYYDRGVGSAPPELAATALDEHAFRTPVLRNVARTAPYWHDGRYPTLTDVLQSEHGETLHESERNDLLIFLLALNGAYPARPWSDWPAR